MGAYVIRRLIHTIFVVFAALVVIFVLVRLSGDPAAMMAGVDASPEDVARLHHEMGLDRPLYVQFGLFLEQAVRGDFGNSLRYGSSALPVVVERLPATIQLTVAAMVLTIVVGVPIGIISAVRRGTMLDRVTMIFAVLGQTIPVFWLGILLILLFAVRIHWFPTGGRGGFSHLILPAIALATFNVARVARLVRSEMLDVVDQEFIRVARSKGLTEQVIVLRHALRNAAIPVITILGLQIGHLLSGAVITETVFAWPGMGRLLVQAIQFRDFPVIQVAVLFLALTVAVINLLVDLSYAWLDPRIKYS